MSSEDLTEETASDRLHWDSVEDDELKRLDPDQLETDPNDIIALETCVDASGATDEQLQMYHEMADMVEDNFRLFVEKNRDYGSSFVTGGEVEQAMGGHVFDDAQSAAAYQLLTRIYDKKQRIYNLLYGDESDHVGEPTKETALDMANYALMLAWLIDPSREGNEVGRESSFEDPLTASELTEVLSEATGSAVEKIEQEIEIGPIDEDGKVETPPHWCDCGEPYVDNESPDCGCESTSNIDFEANPNADDVIPLAEKARAMRESDEEELTPLDELSTTKTHRDAVRDELGTMLSWETAEAAVDHLEEKGLLRDE